MGILLIEAAFLLVLLTCSAFFSSSETALFSLSHLQILRLRKTRPKAAERIQRMLNVPTQLLSTLLIGNTLVNVTAAGVGYSIAEQLLPSRGEAVAVPVMTFALLMFGEVTPKRLAASHNERLAVLYARVLPGLMRGLTPLRLLLEGVAGLFRGELRAPSRALTEDEFLSVIRLGEEQGILKAEERNMVDGIIRLEDLQASEVMTPRVDLIGIDLDDPPDTWFKTATRVQFRYLPLYRGSLDHAEGFLDVPRFLLSDAHDLNAARLDPLFVPETAPLDGLLTTFQKEHRRIAFVVDEYGGTAGVITLGDVLEEIVGDLEDEFGLEKLTIQKMGENLWIVDGSASLEEVNYELGIQFEAGNVDRISGWITAQLGRIPHTGEAVETQGCRVTVHRTRRLRIVTVFIEKLAPAAEPLEAET